MGRELTDAGYQLYQPMGMNGRQQRRYQHPKDRIAMVNDWKKNNPSLGPQSEIPD